MCDTDDDEFLSASEGEYEEKEKERAKKQTKSAICIVETDPIRMEVAHIGSNSEKVFQELKRDVAKEEMSKLEEKALRERVDETNDEPIVEEKSKVDVDTGSSQESLLEGDNLSTSGSSRTESQTDSISSEKKRLLEEIVKETLPDDMTETTPREKCVPRAQKKPSTESEKSQDEGGWDDFDVEISSSAASPEMEASGSSDLVAKEDITEGNKKNQQKKKSLDEGGWDDWGDEEPKKAEGWSDWSLVDEKKTKIEKKTTGWGWGGLVSAVGDTFASTIESSLGLPSAEEIARREGQLAGRLENIHIEEGKEKPDATAPLTAGLGVLSGLVSGGIDVLETIGKKTFEAVTVKDDKAGRRRMIFTEDSGQNLSDVLRELREQQEKAVPLQVGTDTSYKLPDMASEFGKSEGIVYLEALEMLSSNRPKATPKFEREYMDALNNVDTEAVEDGVFSKLLHDLVKRMKLSYEPTNLIECDKQISNRFAWRESKSAEELFSDAVQSLSEFTASSVQIVSKLANLLLMLRQDVNFKEFVALFALLSQRINYITSQYTDALSISGDSTQADDLVTQVHVECSTAVDFIREAHRLLCPMFQNL